MSAITPREARKRIAAGDLAPVYLVLGDDEIEKAEVAEAFEQAVDEGLRAFNVDRIDGAEATLRQVVEAAATLPMMAARRIVIVRRAERCLAPKRESRAAAADLAAFEEYLADPYPHAVLVLVAAGLDRRRRTTARLLEAATQVAGDTLASVADAEGWVRRRVAAAGRSIDPAAARFVAARAGPDLPRLRGEVERLLLFVGDAPAVGLEDARMVAGPAAAHDDWAVARAIERGQAAAALRELALIVESGAAPYMVLGQLAWVVRTRMPNHRVAGAVESLYRTDLDLKSSAGDPRVLLERLVVELCEP